MNLTQLFTQVNAAFRGSDDDAPTSGTDFSLWLATTNRKISEWARDGKQTWQSLFEIREIGTISAGIQDYDLDDDILIPADSVIVTTTSNQDIFYRISKPQERARFYIYRSVYISGRDPQILTFQDTITSNSQIIGGTINLGAYFLPEDLGSSGDTIPVDDPYWLVYAVASELAFNDITYSDKSSDLNNKANALYDQMISNNRKGTSDNPRILNTNVNRIRDPHGESGLGTI